VMAADLPAEGRPICLVAAIRYAEVRLIRGLPVCRQTMFLVILKKRRQWCQINPGLSFRPKR
jgi:hypothetical protein